MIKRSAAVANMKTGAMDAERGDTIVEACDQILAGRFVDQFVGGCDQLRGGNRL